MAYLKHVNRILWFLVAIEVVTIFGEDDEDDDVAFLLLCPLSHDQDLCYNHRHNHDCFDRAPGYIPKRNHPTYDVIRFNGERRSFVDIELQSWVNEMEEDDNMYLSFFVYAEQHSGTILEYRGRRNIQDSLKVIINQDRLSIHENEIEQSKNIKVNEWNFVTIKLKNDKGDFNGGLRIGGSLDDTKGQFIGRLGCLSIVLREGLPREKDEEWKRCANNLKSTWEKRCEGAEVKFLWPLNNQSLGFEAIQGRQPDVPPSRNFGHLPSSAYGFHHGTTFLSEKNNEIQMSVKIPFDEKLKHKFSITIFVNPRSDQNAKLLSISQPQGCFYDMTVFVNNASVSASLLTKSYGKVNIQSPLDNANRVNFIAVQVECERREFSMIVNSKYESEIFEFDYLAGESLFALGMVQVELGSSSSHFHGDIACMAIFSTPLDEGTADKLLVQECNNYASYTAPDEGDPKPVLEWPLSETTYGYEVITGYTQDNLPFEQCWVFDNHAVVFYGSDKFSLELSHDGLNLNTISVGFLMKPQVNTSGTIIKAELGSSLDYVIEGRIDSQNLLVEIINQGVTCSFITNIPFDNRWSSILIQISPNQAEVFLGTHSVQPNSACSLSISTDINVVRIFLGKGDTSVDDFRGQIRCLSLFNTTLDRSHGKDLIINGCGLSSNHNLQDGKVSSAAVSWPLDTALQNKTDVDKDSLKANSSLFFDGSSLFHALLRLPVQNEPDIAIGLFVRPSKFSSGTILVTEHMFLKLVMKMKSIQVIFGKNHTECDVLEFGGIESEKWHLLFMQRIPSCKRLIVSVDDEKQFSSSDCLSTEYLDEVNLRLGGEPNSLYNFRGNLSCLALFRSSVPERQLESSMVAACSNRSSLSNGRDGMTITDTGYLTQPDVTIRHQLIKVNATPSNEFPPIDSLSTRSLSHCAGLCTSLFRSVCRSFVLVKLENKTCIIYDFVLTEGLEPCPGARYYGLINTNSF